MTDLYISFLLLSGTKRADIAKECGVKLHKVAAIKKELKVKVKVLRGCNPRKKFRTASGRIDYRSKYKIKRTVKEFGGYF